MNDEMVQAVLRQAKVYYDSLPDWEKRELDIGLAAAARRTRKILEAEGPEWYSRGVRRRIQEQFERELASR